MIVYLVVVSALLSSCYSDVTHGIVFKEQNISMITPGLVRKEDVISIIGTPSFEWGDKWYFVSRKVRRVAFFNPKLLEGEAYIVEFDGDVVSKITKRNANDAIDTPVYIKNIELIKPDVHKILNTSHA